MDSKLNCLVFHNTNQVLVLDNIREAEFLFQFLNDQEWFCGHVKIPNKVIHFGFRNYGYHVMNLDQYAEYLNSRITAYKSQTEEPDSFEDMQRAQFMVRGHWYVLTEVEKFLSRRPENKDRQHNLSISSDIDSVDTIPEPEKEKCPKCAAREEMMRRKDAKIAVIAANALRRDMNILKSEITDDDLPF